MSVPGGWEGGSDALRAGARFMRISSFSGAFLPSAPARGRRAGVGDAPQRRHRTGPELSSPVFNTRTETVWNKTEPLFARKRVRNGPAPASPECGVGTGGTRGDRAAPPPRVSGARNIPRRTAGRTLPQGTIAARALLSKALDSALLLYSVSSAEFWTFPQLPGHRDCAAVTRRRWLLALLGLGGHDGERGCISTSTCIGHALPRQELTSSM